MHCKFCKASCTTVVNRADKSVQLMCAYCKARGPVMSSLETAIEAWAYETPTPRERRVADRRAPSSNGIHLGRRSFSNPDRRKLTPGPERRGLDAGRRQTGNRRKGR